MSRITVIGSINIDLTVSCERWPVPGETIIGKSGGRFFGGKGANQAVAASRLGGNVHMIGCVGDDVFGEEALQNMKSSGVDVSCCSVIPSCKTGTAYITECDSENIIIVDQGANSAVTPEIINSYSAELLLSDIVLMQLEIPLDTVICAVEFCSLNRIPCILNPAPYADLPEKILKQTLFITPNETEAGLLAGKDSDPEDLFSIYRDRLIITRGSSGVEYFCNGKIFKQSAMKVNAVDTTGAGDTFNGALAVAMGDHMALPEAVKFASSAAALAVTGIGAQSAMPFRDDVLNFM